MQEIWDSIFDFYKPITDNVYIVSALFSISVAFLLFLLQKAIGFVTKKHIAVVFGPISMVFSCFIANMTTHLPVLHPRMNRALSITSDIIQKSSTYIENFQNASGVVINGSSSIASFLYFMTEQEQISWVCSPMSLYDSVFRTMEQIRGGLFLPNVDVPCFGSLNWALVLIMGMMVIIAIFTFVERKRTRLEKIWFIISIIFVIYLTTVSSGAAITASIMWLTSSVLFFASAK